MWLPHDNLLCGVSDRGDIFLVNPDNISEYYVAEDVLGEDGGNAVYSDFEGVSFDPYLIETEDERHVYVASEDPAALLKFRYELPSNNNDDPHSFASIALTKIVLLNDALPSFEDGRGVESLTLYRPSTASSSALFFVGLQDNGVIYTIDAEGRQATNDIELDEDGVSGSHYDASTDTLFLLYDQSNMIAAVNVARKRVVASFKTRETQEEGLAVRGDRLYIASDEGGNNPSFIAEHAWFPNSVPVPEASGQTTTASAAARVVTSSAAAVAATVLLLLLW